MSLPQSVVSETSSVNDEKLPSESRRARPGSSSSSHLSVLDASSDPLYEEPQSPKKAKSPIRSVGEPVGKVAMGTGKGLLRAVGAGLKAPATITYGLTRGFHNVPHLYGDTTVRQTERIIGVRSGLSAVGKGFYYGIYDGITDIVTQPIDGARKEGAFAFLKGFGKGIGGAAFKPATTACALPGYTFKGIYEHIRHISKENVFGFIMTARVIQGAEEARQITDAELSETINRCLAISMQQEYEHGLLEPGRCHSK